MNNKYSNNQGECPKCEGNIEYGTIDFEDDQCYFPWKCEECGLTGKEWYRLEFIGHSFYNEEEEEIVLL